MLSWAQMPHMGRRAGCVNPRPRSPQPRAPPPRRSCWKQPQPPRERTHDTFPERLYCTTFLAVSKFLNFRLVHAPVYTFNHPEKHYIRRDKAHTFRCTFVGAHASRVLFTPSWACGLLHLLYIQL